MGALRRIVENWIRRSKEQAPDRRYSTRSLRPRALWSWLHRARFEQHCVHGVDDPIAGEDVRL